MTQKSDLQAYRDRWAMVEEIEREERRSASLLLCWRQLNAAYAFAKQMGWLQPDPSENEVFERWAKLKEKASQLPPKP